MSLRLPSLKRVFTQGSMDSFMVSRHSSASLKSKHFFPPAFFVLTWKGEQTQRRQTVVEVERCTVWHIFRHSRSIFWAEKFSSKKDALDVSAFLWTDQS